MAQASSFFSFSLRSAATFLLAALTACGGGGSGQAPAGGIVPAANSRGAVATQTQTPAASDTPATTIPAANEALATTPLPASTPAQPAILAADARFFAPKGIASDAAGNFYIADTGNKTIRKLSAAGTVSTVAGMPGVAGTADGIATTARFTEPRAITVDGSGNLYVVDANAIRKITPAGEVSTLAGVINEAGLADRPGTAALFSRPGGIAVDSSGTLYVTDTGNEAVRKISASGEVSTLLRLNEDQMHSITIRGTRIYIGGENCMWRVELGGAGVALARIGGEPGIYDSVDGAANIRFWPLYGIATDSAGNVYAAQSFAYPHNLPPLGMIRKMTPSSNGLDFTASTIAGMPDSAGSADGNGPAAQFRMPMGITSGPNGDLYVADTNNHTIRKVTPGGDVTTVAGKAGEAGSN
ncbi:MAG: hypothetical protein JWQ23_2706 [Herminiimonas sp.]|nr:hypothetical protein [Herminiimonas sp.]